MRSRLLLIGVEDGYRTAFERWAGQTGAECVSHPDEAPPATPSRPFSLCVTGGLDGGHASADFRALRKALPSCPIVVVAQDLPTDAVVQLVKAGAADVIGLPAPAGEVVARATLQLADAPGSAPQGLLVGHSEVFRAIVEEVRSVAPLRSTVLLTGETGTGKGLLARTIHELSDRSDRPFVHVDCAALSPTVIESELFGHQRGSFTGAVESRPGRFELARDGTIFLDEIGELDPPLQAKLLRILEDREYERIGSTRTQVMAARVIAATSRDLRSEVEEGRFRADLFFRLHVFHLQIPPLRERREDVPLLVRAGLERLAERLELPLPAVSEGFCERLMEHPWPGNVRELMNLLERVLIRTRGSLLEADALDGLLDAEEFPAAPPLQTEADADPSDPGAIARELQRAGGNVSRAARRLGIPRTTLRYRVRQLGLEDLLPRD